MGFPFLSKKLIAYKSVCAGYGPAGYALFVAVYAGLEVWSWYLFLECLLFLYFFIYLCFALNIDPWHGWLDICIWYLFLENLNFFCSYYWSLDLCWESGNLYYLLRTSYFITSIFHIMDPFHFSYKFYMTWKSGWF